MKGGVSMPCIYAHDSFGTKVASVLPQQIQSIIKTYKDEFRIGLQGPDFLFFYHPLWKLRTNQMGYWQHEHSMYAFLSSLLPFLRKTKTTENTAYAYLLGYICHFVLDSECHSFVIPAAKLPGRNHLAIENEFDRHLLKKDGYQPTTYPMWKKIPITKSVIHAVYQAYKPLQLDQQHIRKSLYGMRFYKRLLTCGCSLKRVLLRGAMKLTMHYDELEGHMMDLRPKNYAAKTNQSLQYLYDNAIPIAKELIEDFHLSVTTGKELNPRFHTTFKNNQQMD